MSVANVFAMTQAKRIIKSKGTLKLQRLLGFVLALLFCSGFFMVDIFIKLVISVDSGSLSLKKAH
ncbi:MAG: hypothetical protein ACREOB_06490 [Thermodesulfobacteriota bacterium]